MGSQSKGETSMNAMHFRNTIDALTPRKRRLFIEVHNAHGWIDRGDLALRLGKLNIGDFRFLKELESLGLIEGQHGCWRVSESVRDAVVALKRMYERAK
jgi:hypothetical protein